MLENMKPNITEIKGFWNSSPCQAGLSREEERRNYFDEISRKRFEGREWHVPSIAKFDAFRGKTVLEIGCGVGTDGIEFAKSGANYIGIDLTPTAVELTAERFQLFGIPGHVEVANAEQRIPANDASIDHVYSFGVIHHSPVPTRIVGEIYRVLKPGGTFTVMLYNRTSINYYIEIMFLRRIFRYLLIPKFMPAVLAALSGFDKWKLEGHRQALRRKLTKQEWISINTDGPFCPLARVYNHNEAADLFAAFSHVKQEVWEFNVEHWSFLGRLIPTAAARWIGRRWGWHRVIYGCKP
jgi:ubiquinone/menaquinone biosynthesis C-methylase UbiE